MNTSSLLSIKVPQYFLPAVLVAALSCAFSPGVQAATLYWNGSTTGGGTGASNTWNASAENWNPESDYSGAQQAWVSGSDANFSGTVGTVTVSGTVVVESITVTGNNYAFTGGTIQLTSGTITRLSGNQQWHSNITGSNGLSINAGQQTFATVAKTYTGNTQVEGTARLELNNVLPTTTIFTNSSLSALALRASTQTFAGLEGSGIVRRDLPNGTSTLILDRESGTSTYNGRFLHQSDNGFLHLVKDGNYTQIIGGTIASTAQSSVAVNGGVLALAKTDGVNALGDGSGLITINGGQLRLDNPNQLAAAQAMLLNGGTFNVNGRSEVLGTLALTADSNVQLGSLALNEGALAFADSSVLDWSSFTLAINGLVDATTLRFGTDAFGLTSAQLSQFRFADYGNLAGQIDSLGYVTPIPEPSAGILIGLGLAAFTLLRRRFV